jgi:cobaltochelatase CobN
MTGIKNLFSKRRLAYGLLALVLIAALAWAWGRYLSPTRIALVNYEDFQMARVVKSNTNRFIQLENLPLDSLEELKNYDAALIFGRAIALEPEQLEQLNSAGIKGAKLYMEAPTNPNFDVTNLRGEDLDFISDYLKYGGTANYRAMLNFMRVRFDGKPVFVSDIRAPIAIGQDLLFYLDEEALFETVAEFESYASENKLHIEGQPRVAMLTSVPGPFNSNRDHVDGMIRSLADKGLNVYPVAAITKRLSIVQEIDPAAVVFMPHGRMTLESGDETIGWLNSRDIPIFGPISVFDNHDAWLEDQQGMNGALLTMSVVLPEFDGVITPYAVAAKFADENGFQVFQPIPERMDKFTAMVRKWVNLKTTPVADKKVAIYYFKGPGKNAMAAGNMEVADSLFNALHVMKDAGYDLGNLPADLASFKQMIQRQGAVLTPYAQGDMARFFEEGNPALVAAGEYDQWCSKYLQPEMCQAITDRYGRAPGQYMTTIKDGIEYIGVARLQFGNITLLPQPLPGVGDNTFALVHGTRTAPPHPYVASYLWTREVFQPDAIVHFGTHGSLEFTPWKQVALSDFDWSDALLGNTPHFYIYTINNVGEAIIAKRRSYATIISHLTAPFMESGVHDSMKELSEQLANYSQLDASPVKNSYARRIRETVWENGLADQLGLPGVDSEWSEQDYFDLANHVELVAYEKVNAGLYTINQPYTAAQVDSTTRLIATDPLAYSVARLDQLRGDIKAEQMEDQPWFNSQYRQPAKDWVERILGGEAVEYVLREMVSIEDRQRADAWLAANRRLTDGEIVGGFIAMGNAQSPEMSFEEADALDLETARDLVVKILPYPERAEFIRTLESEKRFEMASRSLDPETLEQAKVIARAIPEMARGLEISEQPDVNALLRLMQKPRVYEAVFPMLDDPSLAERVANEKTAVQAAMLERALEEDGLKTLSLALNPQQLQSQVAERSKEDLLAINSTLAFYQENHAGLMASAQQQGPNGAALAAMLGAKAFDTDISSARETVSAQVRSIDQHDRDFANAVRTIEQQALSITQYREDLANSPRYEMESFLNALQGGYIEPTPGGDLVRNPRTLPTGRNIFSVDAEQTPTEAAWEVGVKLTESLIKTHREQHDGAYPRKVTFTLWPGDFILTEGAQLAQIFYMLGVEPVRDPFNRVISIKVIPLEKLGRPRIDVVAQTAGQFRDLAASRIDLINQAIEMVSSLNETEEQNYVRSGVIKSERKMIETGIAPAEARELATIRVFGGVNGAYGTGIMGLVEKGDAWEDEKEIAEQYLNNMGAVYGKGDKWSYYKEGVFEAALQDAEVVVQPRESNAWGAVSLDHVYEFMGGLNMTVRNVTGKDPSAYFNDFRNADNPEMQSLEDAVFTETQSTLLNPEYIKALQGGSASAAESLAESFRNTYGWNVMKPDVIKDQVWDDIYSTYVEDKFELGVQEFFEGENPYALQEMTAVMMETARKGLWTASDAQLSELASLHAELIEKYDAGCSGFVCDNTLLREFIAQRLPEAQRQNYEQKIKQAVEAPSDAADNSIVMEKQVIQSAEDERPLIERLNWGLVLGVILLLGIIGFLATRRKHAAHLDEAEL